MANNVDGGFLNDNYQCTLLEKSPNVGGGVKNKEGGGGQVVNILFYQIYQLILEFFQSKKN